MAVTIVGNNTPTAGGVVYGDGANYASTTAGTSGQFLQSTGTGAPTWAAAGIGSVATTSSATDITLTSSSAGYQAVTTTALGKSVILPAATTMSVGGPRFIIKNEGSYPFGIRDASSVLLTAVQPGGIAYVTLKDNSTSAGSWSFEGDALAPGLITIDYAFSTTYQPSLAAQVYAAFDANKSVYFISDSTNLYLYAFVVDSSTGTVGTPVLVSGQYGDTPRACFAVTSTTAILFYDDPSYGTYSRAVVLSVSGSTTLSVGTPASVATFGLWYMESPYNAPQIAQLSSTLYVAGYTFSSTTQYAVAISVSGTTVTIGSPATIFNGAAGSITGNRSGTYPITSTTALITYRGGSSPYTNNAAVVSVSGTTVTAGTPISMGMTSSMSGTMPSVCQLSSTKFLVADDGGTAANVKAVALTISGTTVTAGTAVTVATNLTQSYVQYRDYTCTRYNPHLFTLSSSTALLSFTSTGKAKSCSVVLSESGGVITVGTIYNGGFSFAAENSTNNNGYGRQLPQTTTGFVGIYQAGNPSGAQGYTYQTKAVPSAISGTTITQGAAVTLPDTVGYIRADTWVAARLSQGDHVIAAQSGAGVFGFSILRSSGAQIVYRGFVPTFPYSGASDWPLPTVSTNKVVWAVTTSMSSSVSGGSVFDYTVCRLVNMEIAA